MKLPVTWIRFGCGIGTAAFLTVAGLCWMQWLRGEEGGAVSPPKEIPRPDLSKAEVIRKPEQYAVIHRTFEQKVEPKREPTLNLPISLIMIVHDPDPDWAGARLQDSAGSVAFYKVGETVPRDQAKLIELLPDAVRVEWKEKEWILTLDSATPQSGNSGGEIRQGPPQEEAASGDPEFKPDVTYEIDRDQYQEYLKNFDSTYFQQGRYRLYMENDKPVGVLIANLQPGAEAKRFGIKEGDVVKQVNGRPLNKIVEISNFYAGLQSGKEKADKFQLEVEREGKPHRIQINVR